MKGLQIFAHSVRQVLNNLGPAVRISGLLYAIQLALFFGLGLSILGDDQAMQAAFQSGEFPWGRAMIAGLLILVINLWIAVSWHRYVLKIEEPGGVLPAWRGDRVLAYFGRSLQIGLILIPVIIVAGFVVGILAAGLLVGSGQDPSGLSGSTPLTIAVGIIIYVPAVLIGYRLSVILPAAALGEPYGIGDVWRMTKGSSGTILALAVVTVVLSIVIDLPGSYVFTPQSLPSMIWLSVTGWLKLMIGVSILTTLYGHYAEDRALVFA